MTPIPGQLESPPGLSRPPPAIEPPAIEPPAIEAPGTFPAAAARPRRRPQTAP